MSSLAVTSGAHYAKSLNLFITKSGERMNNFKILQDHLSPLIQRFKSLSQPCVKILSVGSGMGEKDMDIVKLIKEELQKSEQGRSTRIFNRAIEPNEYSCRLYKAAIENLQSPLNKQMAEFDICQQTFEDYKKLRQEEQTGSVKFDMVHFMHSIYFFDIEQTLRYCFEKELSDQGFFACIVEGHDLVHWVYTLTQSRLFHGKGTESKSNETAEEIIKIANDNGWKHEIYTQEYSIDVTEVFDEKSTDGNLLLDFLTQTTNFRETADKHLVEETLALIKDLTTVKDGKRLGDKKELLIFIYK
ncbi:histamine N-methyltransferase-like [Oculina patagonica]